MLQKALACSQEFALELGDFEAHQTSFCCFLMPPGENNWKSQITKEVTRVKLQGVHRAKVEISAKVSENSGLFPAIYAEKAHWFPAIP